MKPFKINRNSWQYKLNRNFFNTHGYNVYYMHDTWEPRHKNFCAYWKVTMSRVIFALILVFFAGLFFFTIGHAAYQNPVDTLILAAIIIISIAGTVGIFSLAHYIDKRKKKHEKVPESLFIQRYKAYKSKICPMVEYDN